MRIRSERVRGKAFAWGVVLCWILLMVSMAQGAGSSVPVYGYKVVQVFPHDPEAFTQGLVFYQGVLYESTGLLGKSTLRKVDLETGRPFRMIQLPDHFFGEGIALWKDRIIQLTWRSGTGLVYDRKSFRQMDSFRYGTEGWGLTQDGSHLIMSDGTAFLYFLDPQSFKEVRRIEVRDQGVPIALLNELEFIKGEIFANIYLTDWIARISPETGQVTAWIDLQGLLTAKDRTGKEDVLNGIAYDARRDRIWVTGKFWPKLFEIRLTPKLHKK